MAKRSAGSAASSAADSAAQVAEARIFEIYNAAKRQHPVVAELRVGADLEDASITILPHVEPGDLPLMLALFLEDGQREVPQKWTKRWIEERVPPAGRQNIGEILRANGLESYDLLGLLVAGCGRSSHDDYLIREKVSRIEYHLMVADSNDREPVDELCIGVGKSLAEARKAAGLTQRELAERTGVDQAAISKIERGAGNPTIRTLQTLAEGVGCRLQITVE